MRSSRKPRTGLLIVVLLLLAALQIGAGTFAMLKYREYMTGPRKDTAVEEEKQEAEEETDDIDQDEDEGIDVSDDPEDEEEEEDTDESEEDEDDEEEEDEEEPKDYVVMVVSAPDNYAAVRTGRGTTYEEVGRITNGHKVALTDLQNGWYKIAKGKYKGYYTHQSSFVSE